MNGIDRYILKVGTHEKPYRTFVCNAIYVSVPGLIDPRVIKYQITPEAATGSNNKELGGKYYFIINLS